MGVQENKEAPTEVTIQKSTMMDNKKYIIVKNHVRELNLEEIVEASSSVTDNETKKGVKTIRKSKKSRKSSHSDAYIEDSNNAEATEISKSDLEELRTVYNKCKGVITKIEQKYGHLLDLSEPRPSQQSKRSNAESEESENDSQYKCQCVANKKIIFNDTGTETSYPVWTCHSCPKKLRCTENETNHKNIEIAYDTPENLPDNLQTLNNIAMQPHIPDSYRFQILEKLRQIKQDNINEIRFSKPALIEELKKNVDNLGFVGSNISSLSGYPYYES